MDTTKNRELLTRLLSVQHAGLAEQVCQMPAPTTVMGVHSTPTCPTTFWTLMPRVARIAAAAADLG